MGEPPEMLCFNLNWPSKRPEATTVLQTLLSFPLITDITQLFKTDKEQVKQNYELRGMICYGSNHYFALFRRMFHKIEYLSSLDL